MINRRNFVASLSSTCLAFALPISKNVYKPYQIGQKIKHKLLNEDDIFTIISIGTPKNNGFLYFKEVNQSIFINNYEWIGIKNCKAKNIYIIKSEKPCYAVSQKVFYEDKRWCDNIKDYYNVPKATLFISAHDHIIPT